MQSVRNFKDIPSEKLDYIQLASDWNGNANLWNSNYGALGDPLRQYAAPFDLIKHLISPIQGRRILDAGCGGGYLSILLAKAEGMVTGIDFSEKQIAFAKQKAVAAGIPVDFIHGNITNMDKISGNTFDAVVSVTVLSNVPDIENAFIEIARVSKPGGCFLFN